MICVGWINECDKPVATADTKPIRIHCATVSRICGTAPTAVILQAAVDFVITIVIDSDVIELADGDMAVMIPVVHAIVSDIDATIAAQNHVLALFRVDPHGVIVGMNSATAVTCECLAAVTGSIQRCTQHIDVFVVSWIDANLTVVHRSRIERVDSLPALATIFRHVDSAKFFFRVIFLIELSALLVRTLTTQCPSQVWRTCSAIARTATSASPAIARLSLRTFNRDERNF